MKLSVRISRGIESLFGTRDENIRLLEKNLRVEIHLRQDSLEIEGENDAVGRTEAILGDYVTLVTSGHTFANGDLTDCLRVVSTDPSISLRELVESGRQRTFGKKNVTPKTLNQRIYLDALEKYDLVFGVGRRLVSHVSCSCWVDVRG